MQEIDMSPKRLRTGEVPEADLEREATARGGIIGRDHRIVGRQLPFGAILFGGHVVIGAQIALEHFQLLAVFEADQIIGLDRIADRHGGLLFGDRRLDRLAETGQRFMNLCDHARQIADRR